MFGTKASSAIVAVGLCGPGLMAIVACAAATQAPPASAVDLSRLLPPKAEHVYSAIERRVTGRTAMEVVVFMDRFWRVAGNPGFVASQDDIRARLIAAGFAAGPADKPGGARVWFEEFPAAQPGWDHTRGTLSIVASGRSPNVPDAGSSDVATDEVVLSRERHRVALCINSFPTAAGGLVARLVDVEGGDAPADYANREVRGAVVLGDAPVRRLWDEAVVKRGAAGVVSTALPDYVVRSAPGFLPTRRSTCCSGAASHMTRSGSRSLSQPRGGRRPGFARRSSLVRRESGSASRHSFMTVRTGRSSPKSRARTVGRQRIVMVAHIQEPGANDDASGCGTLFEIARGAPAGIARGRAAAAGADADVPVGGRDPRKPRSGCRDHPEEAAARAVHVLARHDRRGHGEDRRDIPDREAAGSRPRSGRGRPIRIPNGARARSSPRR